MAVHFTKVVINSVLTYITASLSNSDQDSIKNACKQFYSHEELLKAKEVLWGVGNEDILGPLIKRRDSVWCNEVNKVIDDLVTGISKLDMANALPPFAVGSDGLARIPRVSPHETLPHQCV